MEEKTALVDQQRKVSFDVAVKSSLAYIKDMKQWKHLVKKNCASCGDRIYIQTRVFTKVGNSPATSKIVNAREETPEEAIARYAVRGNFCLDCNSDMESSGLTIEKYV